MLVTLISVMEGHQTAPCFGERPMNRMGRKFLHTTPLIHCGLPPPPPQATRSDASILPSECSTTNHRCVHSKTTCSVWRIPTGNLFAVIASLGIPCTKLIKCNNQRLVGFRRYRAEEIAGQFYPRHFYCLCF
ncbi:hypothetical protein CDAR_27601 [Caerostris darwini]|uniref:Uncharacterized protein n=1 Tax=Caerostris darwini TaxID=1538125 RepID=A0AAV4STB5_9ARAC|nr:hypothetical protein CDAR_27601 [Caerostris darwini]